MKLSSEFELISNAYFVNLKPGLFINLPKILSNSFSEIFNDKLPISFLRNKAGKKFFPDFWTPCITVVPQKFHHPHP